MQSWEALLGSTFLAKLRKAIMQKIVMAKWRELVLSIMNYRAAFDLSGVNQCLPIHSVVEQATVDKRRIFYRFQLDVLRKTAEPLQLAGDLDGGLPRKFYHCNDYGFQTWRADDNFEKEFYPHEIVTAIRLTKPAHKRQYMFIPTLTGFYKINDRLCLQITCQKYRLR